MVKSFFLFSTLLCAYIVSSQATEGKIIYKIDMERFQKKESSNNGPSAGLINKMANYITNLNVELLFNTEFAVFRHPKTLPIDNDEKIDLMAKSLVSRGQYYTNLIDSTQIFVTEYEGQVLNVESKFKKNKWILTKETKLIGDFICYKATLNKKIAGNTKVIIAWYSPEIPLPFGPKDYVGQLPGLILELDEPFLRYRCSTIIMNQKQSITWPKEVETISEEQFDDMFKSIRKKIQATKKT